MGKFTVAKQYALYLEKMRQSEKDMHPEQRKQVKNAFYGAWGQCLLCMRDEVSELSEDGAIDVMEAAIAEVGNHFLSQADRQN